MKNYQNYCKAGKIRGNGLIVRSFIGEGKSFLVPNQKRPKLREIELIHMP